MSYHDDPKHAEKVRRNARNQLRTAISRLEAFLDAHDYADELLSTDQTFPPSAVDQVREIVEVLRAVNRKPLRAPGKRTLS